MEKSLYFVLIFAVMGLVAAVLTVYDKHAAKVHKYRIPEKVLMLVAFFGGAVVMYPVMLFIRHKTQHKKFTVGLPIMIVLHTIIIIKAVFL